MVTRISFITIGNELLKGTIINTNAAQAGQLLRKQGYALQRVVTIADDKEAIDRAVREELAHSHVVLVSGGLGPTKDDITKHVLAEAFGATTWGFHQPTVDHLEQRYNERGRTLNDLTRQQAWVPDVCEVVPNRMGTAPGMRFTQDGHHLYAMPGVPVEMLTILEEEIIPRIQAEFSAESVASRVVRITGVPESEAAQRIDPIESRLPPDVALAYLPRLDGIWLETSVHLAPHRQAEADKMVTIAQAEIAALFQAEAYAKEETPVAQLVQNACIQRGVTLAVAESLTGGQVAASLVSVSGASTYFKGAVTAYAISAKTDMLNMPPELIDSQGVVSEAVVTAMASHVRKAFSTDIGLATTGLAESDGETPAQAWLGYADPLGTDARHLSLIYNRNNNRERATQQLLVFALQLIGKRFPS